jgi:transcriptional regulator with XRE-family HTH domain
MQKKKTQRLRILGDRIRAIRKSKGWSQEAFAMEAGLDRSYVGGIERGERNITFETLCLIAEALDMDLSELVKGI